ncbi:MAG: hypothetical protein K1X94_31230, partial [Sandaracinaceae bacterium]|nr:hypothetical protein [Sandaracinaceae bacterium]
SPAPSVEPVRPAPRSSAPLVATLAIALLALGGGAGLYAMQSASVAPTPTSLPALPTATTPSTPVTPPPTTDTRAALLPPPPTDEVRLGPDPRAHGPRHTQVRDEAVPPSTREAQGMQTTLHAETPEITQPAHVDPPAVIVPPATSEPRPEQEGVRTPERSEERHDPAPERTTQRPPERADPPATTTPPSTTEGARLQVGTGVGRLRGSH